jgi:hypothetical protein
VSLQRLLNYRFDMQIGIPDDLYMLVNRIIANFEELIAEQHKQIMSRIAIYGDIYLMFG